VADAGDDGDLLGLSALDESRVGGFEGWVENVATNAAMYMTLRTLVRPPSRADMFSVVGLTFVFYLRIRRDYTLATKMNHHCLTPTAHQKGSSSEKRMSRSPARFIIASISERVNRRSNGVPKRSRLSVRIV
jgi:hypothetical protein